MRKYINYIFAIIATAIVVYTFVGEDRQFDIFGIEMNVWIYRMIWVLIAVSSFYRAYNMKNEEA